MHRRAGVIREDARRMLDWRNYLGSWPIAGLAIATLAGYWLMPGRRVTPTVKLDEASIEDLIRRGGVKVQQPVRKESWLRNIVRMAGDMALKLVIAQITREMVQSDIQSTPPRRAPVAQPYFRGES